MIFINFKLPIYLLFLFFFIRNFWFLQIHIIYYMVWDMFYLPGPSYPLLYRQIKGNKLHSHWSHTGMYTWYIQPYIPCILHLKCDKNLIPQYPWPLTESSSANTVFPGDSYYILSAFNYTPLTHKRQFLIPPTTLSYAQLNP